MLAIALGLAVTACTTGGDGPTTLAEARVAVEQQTDGFRAFTSTAGESYDVAVSKQPLGDARVLLMRPNLDSPALPDIDAATTNAQIVGIEYASDRVCEGVKAALEPARPTGAYDQALNGWGWKVRCG